MLDSNWEILNGDVAHEIEALNYANQVHVIEALIKLLIATGGISDVGSSNMTPNVDHLKELHRTATLFLLKNPGAFRDGGVFVQNGDGSVRHMAPTADTVESHIADFFNDLNALWPASSELHIAAFCLWKINWIHPFPNGNGRTARAFAYACLNLKAGFFLPGRTTVIDLIMTNDDYRTAYNDALSESDAAFSKSGACDVSTLEALLEKLLREQFASIDFEKEADEPPEPEDPTDPSLKPQ